jgi:hypothetical protein
MPKLVFTHEVKDVNYWLSLHAERVKIFSEWASNVQDYALADGNKQVALTMDVHDMEAMQQAMATPEMDAAKEAHGVVGPVAMFVAP